MQKCVLDPEKTCIECGECNICDLNPGKLCDNCCRCIEPENDFETIEIDGIDLSDANQKP